MDAEPEGGEDMDGRKKGILAGIVAVVAAAVGAVCVFLKMRKD